MCQYYSRRLTPLEKKCVETFIAWLTNKVIYIFLSNRYPKVKWNMSYSLVLVHIEHNDSPCALQLYSKQHSRNRHIKRHDNFPISRTSYIIRGCMIVWILSFWLNVPHHCFHLLDHREASKHEGWYISSINP